MPQNQFSKTGKDFCGLLAPALPWELVEHSLLLYWHGPHPLLFFEHDELAFKLMFLTLLEVIVQVKGCRSWNFPVE